MSLVSTKWLNKNISKIKIIDASWHLPNSKRDALKEYKKEHIDNAIFFDIENFSNKRNKLPHMLPEIKQWNKIVSNLGIKNNDRIIIYDNSDVISSCRCWYTFIFFGHDPNLISVLDGGLNKWKKENRKTSDETYNIKKTVYKSKKIKRLVKSKKEIKINIKKKKFKLVDARNKNRFLGIELEPRFGVNPGSVKNSLNLPYYECINFKKKTFFNKAVLKKKFNKIGVNLEDNVVFSCGSGITAAVLSLAYSIINDKYLPIIYDGSWAEYGKSN